MVTKITTFEGEPQLNLIRILCGHGASPNILNNIGKDAFDLIEEEIKEEIEAVEKGKLYRYRVDYLQKVRKLLGSSAH